MEGVTGSTLQALADRLAQGGMLQLDEAAVVLQSHDLITIGMMADGVRRQMHGARTTFARVFEVHVDAVPSDLPGPVSAGEFRIVGAPGSSEEAVAAVGAARRLAGRAWLAGFSLPDLLRWPAPDRVFRSLRDAGLDAIAAVPVDLSGGAEEAIGLARAAGLRVHRATVHAAPADPLALAGRVRELQRAVGGFRVFAPLPRVVPAALPTTGYDDVKMVALARLALPEMLSIQVDWPLYGPKLAQVALTVGADDVDGVAAFDSGTLGARRTALEEIRGNIRAAGLQAVERDGAFEIRGPEAPGGESGS
jgi:aminodeoxyfutalosine synthase